MNYEIRHDPIRMLTISKGDTEIQILSRNLKNDWQRKWNWYRGANMCNVLGSRFKNKEN